MGEHGILRPGEVFAGYTIERVLGVGGWAPCMRRRIRGCRGGSP